MTSQAPEVHPESRSDSLPVLDRIDPYMDWAKAQGVPIVDGYYVEDMATLELAPWARKGGRGAILNLDRTNEKDAHIVELAPGGTSEPEHHLFEKIDWQPGTLAVVPYDECLHQHFNSGPTPARYIAILSGSDGGRKFGIGPRRIVSDVSMEDGGNQLEYEAEDPEIHRLFEAELAANGATCRMKALVPWCTGEAGPTSSGEWGDG